jgi:hypothetical protein
MRPRHHLARDQIGKPPNVTVRRGVGVVTADDR